MRYLLDTVALITWWTESERLGAASFQLLEASSARIFLSPVNIWEIANKNRIGKLDQIVDFPHQFPALCRENGFVMLDLTTDHAMRAGYLPGDHRDPFDRLIAGQALVEDMIVLTNDPQIAAFGCKVLW